KYTEFYISKKFGNPLLNTFNVDNNVSFEVYDSNGNLYTSAITDDFGETFVVLYYDEYNIVQSTTNLVSEKVDDYTILLSDFYSNNNYSIYTPVYDSYLKIYVYESGSTIPINNIGISIDDVTYVTNEEGYFITNYLNEGSYEIQQEIKEGYYQNSDIIININENSTFYLEDGKPIMDFIIYLEKIPEIKDVEEEIVVDSIENDSGDISEKSTIVENNCREPDKKVNNQKLPNLYVYFFNISNKEIYKC
ncbi:MAG TPA: hypothetical protein PLC53_00140, partial [Bacilli bacterium]|nr:hypothetical protein [Bacilli bacterium]